MAEIIVDANGPTIEQRGFGGGRGGLVRLVLRRILLTPVIILGVSLAVFVVIDLSPNDPARASLGLTADSEMLERYAAEHGLNDPLPIRYWRFLGDIIHFDFGDSLIRPESVRTLLGQALPATLQLMALAILLTVAASLIFGTWAAWAEGRTADRLISLVVAVVQAAPSFWIGLIFIQVFAVKLGVLPSGGYAPIGDGLGLWFKSLIGPAIVLAAGLTAGLTRVIRASMADELSKDYVRTAIGAGVPIRVVLSRNVLRNALITPITVLGVIIGSLISGAILVEVVFNIPGMGTLLITGVVNGDLPTVRGVAIVGAVSFVVVNLLVDVAYLLLNPRSAEQGDGR